VDQNVKAAAAVITTLLLGQSSARAERDLAFEESLGSAEPTPGPVGPDPERPQLIKRDRTTRPLVGALSAGFGVVSLVAGGAVYVARQNYRLELRPSVGPDVIDGWEARGSWALGLAGFGAANLIAAEYLLLPDSSDVPTLAWIGGVAGLGVAAVGVGFWLGGTHCMPIPAQPGTEIPRDCLSGVADATFGPLLVMGAVPLMNLPLVFLLRKAFEGAPESLTFTGTGVGWTGRF
jgi:hypothetical protein